ncbi:MAG: hypothetical protein HYX68_15310 [Planctomycetes bacterium]|nr:hypothetical protein [Planctomycetota bacterium]
MLAGMVIYVRTEGAPRTPARVGVVLRADGRPVLVTVQCAGRWVGSAKVVRAESVDTVVWSAEALVKPGSRDVAMSGPVPGYGVDGNLENVPAEVRLELGSVADDRGVAIGESRVVFRRVDLRVDEVLVGVIAKDGSLRYMPRGEFAGSLPRC